MFVFVARVRSPPLLPSTRNEHEHGFWLVLVEMEKTDRISGDHLVDLMLGDAGKIFLDHAAGVGPVGFQVRKIVCPHDPVHSHLLAHDANSAGVAVEAPIAMFPDILAGSSLELRQTQHALHPKSLASIFVVALIHPIGDPADLDLRDVKGGVGGKGGETPPARTRAGQGVP